MRAPEGRRKPGAEILALVGLMLISTVLFGWLGLQRKIPMLVPDEYIFGNIAQALAAGDGPVWRGQSPGLFSYLYSYVIAPAWLVATGTVAYDLAKVINAFVISIVAVPTWLLACEFVSKRAALIPAALMLSGSWMALSANLMAENVALPVSTACLAALVVGANRESRRPILLAVGLWLIATVARLQLVVLGPIILFALLLDILRRPVANERRRMYFIYRPFLFGIAGSFVGALALAASSPGILGRFGLLAGTFPDPLEVLSWSAQHLAAFAIAVAVVPLVTTLALASRKRNWRSAEIGALLAVVSPAVIIFALAAGWFVGDLEQLGNQTWIIERYMVYCAPLIFTGFVVAWGQIRARDGVMWSALLALLAGSLSLGADSEPTESGAVGAVAAIFGSQIPLGTVPTVLIACLVGLIGVVGSVMVSGLFSSSSHGQTSVGKMGRLSAAATVLVAAVIVGQFAHSWDARQSLSLIALKEQPADRSWVNALTHNDVAAVTINRRVRAADYATEFFNPVIDKSFVLASIRAREIGPTCPLYIEGAGLLTTNPECGPVPRRLLIRAGRLRAALQGESAVVQQRLIGRLSVSAGPPALLALWRDPCFGGVKCSGRLIFRLWLRGPEHLTLRFTGGEARAFITVGRKRYWIPAKRQTDIRLSVLPKNPGVVARLSWHRKQGSPALESVVLTEGRWSTRLF